MNHATVASLASTRSSSLPARLTWKDANGAMRFTSVKASDLTDTFTVG